MTGAGLFLGALNVAFRDVQVAIPFIERLLFFVSPVLYPADLVPEQLLPLYYLNPLALVLSGFPLDPGRGPGAATIRIRRGHRHGLHQPGHRIRRLPQARSHLRGRPVSDPAVAIEVRGIGKRYTVGTGRQGSSIVDRVGGLTGGSDRDPFGDSYIWALKDVSFEVPTGKVVGLLGRNGSGKTTMVQILSRVTAPTEGTATVNGRVGALFQAGAGFHPELTGRENIALSGAILGMGAEQTKAAYDQIVEFAGIGAFLDAPVKHYSSGMYQRLAFSVSAHLEAEIMLIDEALSVGDAAFQAKCSQRIRSMVLTGRTVVFVSHSLDSVRELCDSALVLETGTLAYEGEVDGAIDFYKELNQRQAGTAPQTPLPRPWR